MTSSNPHFRRLIDDSIYWLGRLAKNDDLHRRQERPENMARPVRLEEISAALRRYASLDAKPGIDGAMTPWLVDELRDLGFDLVCLDARHARAALKMQINKTDPRLIADLPTS